MSGTFCASKPGQISKHYQLYTWPIQVWCLWTISYWFLDGINDQQLCRGLLQGSMFSGMIITEWESVDKLANCETRGLITTLRHEQNGCHFADHISFSNSFSWMKMFEFQIQFHWNVFLMLQLTLKSAVVQLIIKRNKYLQTGSLVNTIFPYLQNNRDQG